MFAVEIQKRRVHHHAYSNRRWHLDEVFVKINGETHYLWRAVDHEGEVLESFVTKRRDRRAAMVQLGNEKRQEIGRWLNNRGENFHLAFRRREHSMQRFRREKALQKFVSVHSAVCNHFNHERNLVSPDDVK